MSLKRLVTILCIAFLCPLLSFAVPAGNNSLRGTVSGENGKPLAGAVVSIPDLRTGVSVDSSGFYTLKNLPKGKYLVQVHLLSYGTITTEVPVDGETKRDFTLKESLIERNEVVITGTSMATEERRSTTPIQSIRMKELHENVSTNVIDAITKLPGVNQLSTGPAISKPVIRGLGYNRIITLNDGVRQEGQQWGDEHGIEIDDYNVSRIEVLKGPASLAYGSDALAGVINIISDEPLTQGRIEGNITGNYQTNNGLQALHAHLGGNNDGISWGAYYTGKRAHDYQNVNDGYVYDSRFRNNDFGFNIGVNKRWGYSRLSFSSYNQQLGISEGDRDSATGKFVKLVNDAGTEAEQLVTDADGKDYNRAAPYQRIGHQKIAWNNSLYLNNGGRLGLTLGYQQNTRKEFGDVLDLDKPGLSFLLQTFTYDLKYFFPTWNGWQVSTGVNGMQQHNSNKGIEFLVPDYNLFDIGAYAIAKKDWKKWSVTGGLRVNYRKIQTQNLFVDSLDEKVGQLQEGGYARFSAFDKSFSNISGSAGASYAVSNRTALKFNLSSGFRAPNIAELSANGVHEGTIRYEYGSTGLKAESSFQGDVGVVYNGPHISLNAAVFGNYIHNYIYIRKLSGVNGADSIPAANNAEGYPAFIYAQQNAFLYGGELYVDLHPHPLDWLHLENTFSYVRGVATNGTDSTRNLPNIPAARWLVELRAQQKSLGGFLKNAYAKIGLDVNFEQNNIFSAYSTETTSPAYTLINAGIGMDVVNKKQQTLFTLTIAANNLADVAYQNHLSRLRYAAVNNVTGNTGIYGMGRNVSFMVSIPLVLKS